LRERKEDIIILANYFLSAKSPVRSPKKLSSEASQVLEEYDFTGNVRELEHIIERAIIFAEGDSIYPEDLNLPNTVAYKSIAGRGSVDIPSEILSMEDLERWHIAKVLDANRWDRTVTANQLGISPKTLYTKIKKYELKQD
jgi:DNA-binding NtrC family response regulator